MDLNQAMVNLYKQRSGATATRPKRSSNKNGTTPNPTTINDNNKPTVSDDIKSRLHNSMIQDLEASNQSKQKQNKIEEMIAALDTRPKTSFEQLFGVEDVKEEIEEIVDRFKRAIKGQTERQSRPVLVCGSKGLGKTSLVEAAAHHGELNLIPIQLTQMVELTRNEFKETLELLIRLSINKQPAIVLIDNLEEIADKEESRLLIRGAVRRLLADQLKLLVFCTSSSSLDGPSYIEFLDTIHLKRPNSEARFQMLNSLRINNDNLKGLTDNCLEIIATNTPSFTASDLRNMLDIAKNKSREQLLLKHCEIAIERVKRTFEQGTHLIGEKPTITWNDVGGMTEVKKKFLTILRKTRRPGRGSKFAGVALHGPPGCGKTMVAQAMANEAGFNFISVKPGELVDKFLGETEKNIRRVFQEAREHEPCIIYFDEFDGLCGTRENKSTLTGAIQTLLTEMDGFISRGQSIIMVSTNRPQDIDPAMMRPGRLTKKIYVGPPDQAARREILSLITSKPWLALAPDVDLDMWAAETNLFTGAELNELVEEAEEKAENELDDTNKEDRVILRQEHFLHAMNEIHLAKKRLDNESRSIKKSKHSRRIRPVKRPKLDKKARCIKRSKIE